METIIIAIISIFASGGFWSYMQYLAAKKERDKQIITKETVDNLLSASLCTLHSQLYKLSKSAIKRGYITQVELDELENVYPVYHALGGNGTGTNLYNKARALPINLED